MNVNPSLGIIDHTTGRKTDYLYRVSIKCLVRDSNHRVLVVKESGRDFWDLPGGGMDHSENLKSAIAREMLEEVRLTGDFTHRIIHVDEPLHLSQHNFWQIRLIFELLPDNMTFSAGEDADEIQFVDPNIFKDSDREVERRIYEYYLTTSK